METNSITPGQQNAGFFVRLMASFMDTILSMLVFVVSFVMLSLLFWGSLISNRIMFHDNPPEIIFEILLSGVAAFLLACIACFGFFYVQLKITEARGGSIGKLLFGLEIHSTVTHKYIDVKTALYRALPGYLFSGAFLWLGYISIIRHPEKLAWHDQLFGTKVVKKGSGVLGYILFAVTVVLSLVLAGIIFRSAYDFIDTLNTVNEDGLQITPPDSQFSL